MSVRPTFAGFYTARSGIVASQSNLNVTGQNIGNVNTPGYTRQRADLYSIGDNGYKSRKTDSSGIYIGQGVNVGGISQLRDSGLDVRFRHENTKYAYEDTKLSGLEDLAKIFDATQADGMENQLNEFLKAIQGLNNNASSAEQAGIVQDQAVLFTKILNQYSRDLDAVEKQQQSDFKITVEKINTTLEKIANLNKMIKDDKMYNNPSLELKDSRNMLLDELSGYMNINYSFDAENMDELTINFVNADGEEVPLVINDEFVQLKLEIDPDNPENNVIELESAFDNLAGGGILTMENTNTGALGAYFDILGGTGSFGDDISNRGIPYYKDMVNTFASTFAQQMNELNEELGGEPLFESTDGEDITAANINISQAWVEDKEMILNGLVDTDGSIANGNLNRYIALFKSPIAFETPGGDAAFTGTFNEMIGHISISVGSDVNKSKDLALNFAKIVTGIDNNRMSISSVDENEEAANIMMFTKSFNASSRMMTALDEVLDTLINRTGVVGR